MRSLDLSLDVSSQYSGDIKIMEDLGSDKEGGLSFDPKKNSKL